jgi:hypothetical protein
MGKTQTRNKRPNRTRGHVVDPIVRRTMVEKKMLKPIRTETRISGAGNEVLRALTNALKG